MMTGHEAASLIGDSREICFAFACCDVHVLQAVRLPEQNDCCTSRMVLRGLQSMLEQPACSKPCSWVLPSAQIKLVFLVLSAACHMIDVTAGCRMDIQGAHDTSLLELMA